MFTDAELRALHEKIMDLMVRAGWLRSYTFTEGKGFHLEWTMSGTLIAVRLKQIIRACGLTTDDRAPAAFDKLAHGERLDVAYVGELDPEDAALWRNSVAELGIARTEDDLLILVGIIDTWAPDANTGVRLG